MIRFSCDYLEGCHPRILERLMETNLEQTAGYGMDSHCERARELIQKACECPLADVHFLVGGTQTNKTVIASVLKPYQGVISVHSGHINVHETGAIEATGHKVLPIYNESGRLTASQVEELYLHHIHSETAEHEPQPGMVYISSPAENGTIYSKKELEDLHRICKKYDLPLFLDGARLGYGLCAENNDVTLADLARLCDVFYIGGTKVGAMFGEAVVITNDKLKKDFRYLIKQNGGMLAKGRLLGIQFETLFEDGLYFEISQHAIDLAMQIKAALEKNGYPVFITSHTNQQFPILENHLFEKLSQKYAFEFWGKFDEAHSVVRICTSWATKEAAVKELIKDLENNAV